MALSYVIGEDGKYDDLPLTNLPGGVDSWEDKSDVTQEQIENVNTFKQYMAAGNVSTAQEFLNSHSEIKPMIINSTTINQIGQAIIALERMFTNDIGPYISEKFFVKDSVISEYTHSYNSLTQTHNFTSTSGDYSGGFNAKAKIKSPYHAGDKFAINGVETTAYMSGSELTKLFDGEYMYFIIDKDTNKLYFIGGGDTSVLMPKNGGTFSGNVYFGNQNYYATTAGDSRFNNVTTTGNIAAVGNVSGAKVYSAVYNDYAEYFPRGEETEAGDIIALDMSADSEVYVKATSGSHVVGVHSCEYAHLIGGEQVGDSDSYEEHNIKKFIPVGLAGRCSCKVIGRAKKGDYIVASDMPGVGIAVGCADYRHDIVGFAVEDKNTEGVGLVKIKLGR